MNTYYALAFVLLVAGVSATPDLQQRSNERFGESTIRKLIEDLKHNMRAWGMDPMHREGSFHEFKFGHSDMITVVAVIGDMLVEGLSDIEIKSVDVSLILMRIRLHLSWPHIYSQLGHTEANVKLFGKEFGGKVGGSIAVTDTDISIEARVSRNVITGKMQVRYVNVVFAIHDIESDIELIIPGFDLSNQLNNFFNEILPKTLNENSAEINRWLEEIIKQVIENA